MAVRQPAPKVTDSKNSSFFLGLALCQAFFVGGSLAAHGLRMLAIPPIP